LLMPDWKAEIKRRLAKLKLEPTREAAIIEELSQHLADCYAEWLASGATEAEATRAALAELSGSGLLQRELRRVERQVPQEPIVLGANRRANMIADLWQDLRFGARMLAKNPGFTLVAMLTLALGIGASTAIFSLMNATLLRPLPYKNPDQIMMVWGTNPGGYGWRGKTGFSGPAFLDYRQQNQVFEHMATFNGAGFTLTGTDRPDNVLGGLVTAEFFDVLAVQPILGRLFLPEEAQTGRDHVAVLNYNFWQQRFGSDPNIIGQTIRLDATPYTVVGVLPQGFDFSIPDYFESRDLWVPGVLPRDDSERGHKYLSVIARLKPGVTPGQAEQDLSAVTERLALEYPRQMEGFGVKLIPLHEQLVGDLRLVLLLMFGAVSFVLLIACANVANLQLARASARQKEIAIRTALGANRGRLLRQLLTESVLLALIGGVLGLFLASWGIGLLTGLGPAGIPQGTPVTLNPTVLAYSLALSLITGILFGLAPALQPTPTRLSESLKEGGRNSAASQSGLRLRRLLTVSEVALSMILLIGAGLLLRSFVGLLQVNPGFETRNILTARFDLPKYAYPEATKQSAFYTQVMERIKALPGVTAVGATDELPPTMGRHANSFSLEGRAPIDQSSQSLAVQERLTSADYFRAMGVPLVAGRLFSDTDDGSAAPVALVNQTFVRRFFPSENPIGQHLRFGAANPWITIVGIVGDVRGFGLDKQPNSEIYLSYQQQKFLPYNPLANMHLVVRTAGDPNGLAAAVLGAIRELDKELPLPTARTMETVLAASIAERRSNMLLLSLFAIVALLLATAGIYGVMSYAVTQRTQEIGIRMALGAQAGDVLRMVVNQGLRLALCGVALGLITALALTHLLKTLLFTVSATDPLTFAGTALLMLFIALLAALVPARRATRIDPMAALRCE
jgi:putative ABC transport system permease protein